MLIHAITGGQLTTLQVQRPKVKVTWSHSQGAKTY